MKIIRFREAVYIENEVKKQIVVKENKMAYEGEHGIVITLEATDNSYKIPWSNIVSVKYDGPPQSIISASPKSRSRKKVVGTDSRSA